MNCCDASGRCHNGPHCAARQPSTSAPLRFAPGVIERHHATHRQHLRRWLIRSALLIATVTTAAFLSGLISGLIRGA